FRCPCDLCVLDRGRARVGADRDIGAREILSRSVYSRNKICFHHDFVIASRIMLGRFRILRTNSVFLRKKSSMNLVASRRMIGILAVRLTSTLVPARDLRSTNPPTENSYHLSRRAEDEAA